MNNLGKLVTRIGLISLFSVMPLAAQVAYGVKFTAPFPFYVGDTQMPSGSYSLTQPDDLFNKIAQVKSEDGLHSAYINVLPTESLEPPRQSKVVFEKYGNTLYFDRVILQGDTDGIAAESTKAEKKAQETASVVEERSVAVAGQ
jgi:hypothetical protein